MTDFFFYGTLCHPPLLAAVLGRDAGGVPAVLDGHGVRWAEEGAFPVLVAEPGSQAPGVLVRGLGPEDRARLDYYEGGFAFDLVEYTVSVAGAPHPAQVYQPRPGQWQAGTPWSLADWQARWGEVVTATAGDVMAMRGEHPPEVALARYPQMLVRGASRLRARDTGPTGLRRNADPEDLQVLSRRSPYARFFELEEYDLQHRRFDGQMSPVITRATFVSGDAVTVLPFDPRRDRVLLVEQFRAGPLARGDAQCWQIETIAGRVDPAETPEAAARREAAEEAGLALGPLLEVARYYPSPGAVSEFLYSYVALCDLPDGIAGSFGLAEEGEDIRGHLMSHDRMMELIASGEIANAPLILTALWLDRERPRLRAAT